MAHTLVAEGFCAKRERESYYPHSSKEMAHASPTLSHLHILLPPTPNS